MLCGGNSTAGSNPALSAFLVADSKSDVKSLLYNNLRERLLKLGGRLSGHSSARKAKYRTEPKFMSTAKSHFIRLEACW